MIFIELVRHYRWVCLVVYSYEAAEVQQLLERLQESNKVLLDEGDVYIV